MKQLKEAVKAKVVTNKSDLVLKTAEVLENSWRHLYHSYSNQQLTELDRTGFAFLEPGQIQEFLAINGNYSSEQIGFDLKAYKR